MSILERENESKQKKVCVFGQGFVGLPLTLSFALRGCNAIGVDIDEELVDQINKGITYHKESFQGISIQEILKDGLISKKYVATTDGAEAVKKSNAIIITVGIPIKNGMHIMDSLENCCVTVGMNMKKGDLVVIRSTVIPGTTEEFIIPILEKHSGMKAGHDFYLAYSSERIAEGKAFDEFANMPTLVAGINKESLREAIELLSIVCKTDIVSASAIKVVETAKVFENVQRDVNIAMSQEFARFTETLGIDIFEVVNLANTHKRVNLLTPGPGVGGYCIPNAYYYIEPKAKEMDIQMELLKLARAKNDNNPKFIVSKLEKLILEIGKEITDCKVAVMGLAMKDYSNDDRISPAINICNLLMKRGVQVRAFDPAVSTEYDFKVNNRDEALFDADAVLFLVQQEGLNLDDYEHMAKIMKKSPVLIDCRGRINKTEVEKYGFVFWKI